MKKVVSFKFKLLFVSVVLVVAVVSAAMTVSAAEKVVKVNRILALAMPDGSAAVVSVGLESNARLTDSKVTVSVPDIGLRARRNVDFSKVGSKTVQLEIPVPQVFDPYVRIVFSSDQGKRAVYRPLIFQ